MNYHDYILYRIRKDAEMQPDLFRHAHTQCAECGELVHRDDVIVKQYHTGTMTDVDHFCSDDCHHEWYVKRLRTWGM